MKTTIGNRADHALTFIDALIVIATLALTASFLIAYTRRPRGINNRIACVNNLKQVGLAFRIYAGDNGDQFPMNRFTNGLLVVLETNAVDEYFYLLQNELGTPKILVCPRDEKRTAANNFTVLSKANLSYFVGLDASENLPNSILAGDRNITNGVNTVGGLLNLSSNRPAGFTDAIHINQGNIAIGDGSVQQVSSARLRSEIIPNTGFATNRILLP